MRAAAEELSVSHTVISRHVRNLESRLGVRLVEPHGRSVVLTEDGARYHAQITQAFRLIEAATNELSQPTRRPLRLWCWPGIAGMRMLPFLPELEESLPHRIIHFQPTLGRPDFRNREADAEIYYRSGPAVPRDGIIETELGTPRVLPVASPSLIARSGRERDDLALMFELPWIQELSGDEWRLWLEAAGLVIDMQTRSKLEGVRLWHAHLTIEAARLGQGIALANELLIAPDLEKGTLVEIGNTNVTLGTYVFARTRLEADEKDMQILDAWLQKAMRAASA